MMLDGYRLMIPGPVQLAPDVLTELARPIVPHYGAEWTAYYNETLGLLREVFRTEGDVYPIPGSGSAGLEAALRTIVGPDRHLLVLSNGFFGDRVAAIAQTLSSRVTVERFPVDCPIGAQDLRRVLQHRDDFTAVAVVHSESSSGLLNPVCELANVCREADYLLMVDAISSLGGVDLRMDDWGIDLCVSASQKALEGPPGLALVAVGDRVQPRVSAAAPGSWYLGISVWKEYAEAWGDWHPYPITMAVPAFRALRAGLERVLDEGLRHRIARHRESFLSVRHALAGLGFEPVFPEDHATPTILATYGSPAIGADDVVARLKHEHRILIARGMGQFAGKAFRIGNMGRQATPAEMTPLIDAIGSLVRDGKGKDEQS